jgi:acetolactate synthase-1/2/3 large subunit
VKAAIGGDRADEVLETIAKAKKPVILAGPAMMHVHGRVRIRHLEEATGVPVVGMESPRGIKDPSLGRLARVLGEADAVVLFGKRKDFTLGFGRPFAKGGRVIEMPDEMDAQASCDVLIERAARRKRSNGSWLSEARAAIAYRPPEWSTLRSKPKGPLHPAELCRAVQRLLESPEAVLVCDGGEFGQWSQACLRATHRIINGPAGSIGSALPFAAAAKLAFPAAQVVAMLGDGTFGFHMSEIDTAVRSKLDYLAVVGNDACWNAEHQIQLRAYGKPRTHGLDLLPTRYGAVAAAMGGHGEDLDRPADLVPALERAARSGLPSCVNVAIERLPAPAY